MKNLILFLSLSFIFSAQASFFQECIYSAKVEKISNLATMNERVIGNFRTGIDNYSKLLTLSLSKGQVQPGSHMRSCPRVSLQIIGDKKTNYSIGDILKVRITESNDRSGSFSFAVEGK